MWKNTSKKAPIAVFLGWILFLSLFVTGVLLLLKPYSVSYMENGRLTVGYAIYAIIGMLFSTSAPLVALFITLRGALKDNCKRILSKNHTY